MNEIRRLTMADEAMVRGYIYRQFWGCIEIAKVYEKTGLKHAQNNKDSGHYYGFFIDDKLEGLFLFTNNKRLLLHFTSNQVTKKVDLLKAIKVYKPEYMSGPTEMVEQIWKMFERTVFRYKYKKSMYMAMDQKLPVELSTIYEIGTPDIDQLRAQRDFLVQVEKHFGRSHMTINQLLQRVETKAAEGDYLMATEGDKIVAQAFIEEKLNAFWQIGGVYTMPEARGKGIAKAIVSQLAEHIISQGNIPILAVLQDNKAAIRAYEHNGFEKKIEFSIFEIEF